MNRLNRLPLLDQAGECVAWRDNSHLILLDRNGQTVAEIKGTFLKYSTSADGNSIAALEKIGDIQEKDDENTLMLRWFNRAGQQNGSYKISQHEDDLLPQIIFNANGSHLLLTQPAIARLTFLNNSGQMLHEATIFPDALYSNERPFFLAADSEAFVVLSQAMPSTSTKAVAPTIIYFSTGGNEQWRRELPAGTAGNLAVSKDGYLIAASSYAVNGTRVESTITIFNRNSELQCNLNGLFRRAVFANDGSRLLLMDRRELRAISIPSGELLWKVNLPRRAEMFVEIASNPEQDKIFVLAASSVFKENRFVFENSRILGFDGSGKQQVEMPVKTALNAPVLAISDDGKQLSLAAEGLLQNFTILVSNK